MSDFKRDQSAWAFAGVWSVFVLIVDGFIGSGLVEAVRSEWFEPTPGVVTKSEIVRDSRGRARFNVEYTYTVNGRQYTGTKYDVKPHFVNNGYWYAAHDATPVGAAVTVHYDPDDPGAAYLVPGVRSDALFSAWWLIPFNLVIVVFAYFGWRRLTRPRGFDPALRRCVRETPDGWLVRPEPYSRFVSIAFVAFAALTFCGCFVAGGYAVIFETSPPWWVPLSMCAGAVAVPVWFGLRESGRALVHVNDSEGTITFPHNWTRVAISREQVLGIDTATEIRKTKSGTSEEFVVSVRWRDEFDREQVTKLADYGESADAAALVAWLSERLRLPTAAPVAV